MIPALSLEVEKDSEEHLPLCIGPKASVTRLSGYFSISGVRVSHHQTAATARPWDFAVQLGEGIPITSFETVYRRRIASYFGS